MKIKVDKITGELREDDGLKFPKHNLVVDDFTSANNEWSAVGAYVTATKTLTNGKLSIGGQASVNVLLGSWINRNSISRNIMVSVDMLGGTRLTGTAWARARVHFREGSQGNLCSCHIGTDGTVYASKCAASVSTNISTLPIPNYAHTNDYNAVMRVYENFIGIDLFNNNSFVASASGCDSVISALTSGNNGLTSGDIAIYDNYKSQKLSELVNVVFIGDSNTSQTSPTLGTRTTDLLKTYFKEYPISFMNKGVTGDHVHNVVDRFATDVVANKVNKAKNICVLMIGTNDLSSGDTVASVGTALEALYDTVLANGFELWAVTVPPRTDLPAVNTSIKDLNNLIRKSAKPSVVIDFYSDMIDPSNDNTVLGGMLRSDGLHLDSPACALWANKVKNEVLNVLPAISASTGRFSDLIVSNIASKSAHPTSYKPVFQDTATKELYIYTGA